jgi:hypothetical protein
MRATDNRYESEFRKLDLAKWMMSYGARTKTITTWTGLGRYRVQALSRRYESRVGDHRRRGVSPFQSAFFGKSLLLESESLALAFIASELRIIPGGVHPDARRLLPNLVRGERLAWGYELYRGLVPDPNISLERAILLVMEFAEGQNLFLRHCRACRLPMLLERVGVQHDQCPTCRSRRRGATAIYGGPEASD